MSKLTWRTEKRRVSELIPNQKNPRTLSPKQEDDLKRSLKKFGLVEIPAIDADNTVLAGHQRLMALKLLGRSEEQIEVRMPNRKLTASESEQYLLTSNRVHGDWDWDKLLENFNVETMLASGFDDADLAHLFDDAAVEDDGFDVENELAKIKKPKTKSGDVYALGSHHLICGDSTDPKTLAKLMDGKKADIILTDPPYNIGLSYDKGIGGKKRYGGNVDDNKSDEEYRAFLHSALTNGLAVCGKDAHVFTYCDQRCIWLLQTLYSELGITPKRVCLWIKNNCSPTPGVAFNKQYEPCVYGTVGKPHLTEATTNLAEILNPEIGGGNQTHDDILDMLDIWLAKRIAGAAYEHPTEKPPCLHERPLRRCTKPGAIVLDLFAGSGSLMAACEQMKRSAYMVEREPIFCDLIIRRYEKLTGRKAKQIA